MRAWPIVFSAFFHLGLFTFFLLKKNFVATPLNSTSVEVVVTESPLAPQKSNVLLATQKLGLKKKGRLNLFPSYKNIFKTALTNNLNTLMDESQSDNYPEFDSAAGMSVVQVGTVKSLWNEIDKAIVNNPYLSEFGHTGTVSLKFEITPEGKIVDRSLRVDTRNPILKVISLRALRKALRNDNHELRLPTENIVLTAQFIWSDYETCRRIRGTYRKNLSFCNYSENKLKNYTKSEKALTYLSSLQFGFSAGEEIDKYNREENRRKNGFDPFEEYRRDPDWTTGS